MGTTADRAEQVLSGLIKRSFSLAGHRTSVALEREFWEVLTRFSQARSLTLSALVAAVDANRPAGQPLTSALRLHALAAVQTATPAATESLPET